MDIDVGELGPLQPVYVTFIFILSYHGSMGIFSLSFSARICMCSLCAAHRLYLCYANVTLRHGGDFRSTCKSFCI